MLTVVDFALYGLGVRTLTAAEIEQYREDGYVVVEGVLDDAELHRIYEVIDEFVERSRSVTESDDTFDLEPDHTPERPLLRRLKFPPYKHPAFRELLVAPKILNLVAELIGDDIRYQGSKLNMKLPEIGSPVEWHQDFAFFPHTNDDLLTCGIHLDAADEENGCLLVIPGSHRGPVLDHHDADGRHIGAVDASVPEIADAKPTPVVVPAGGMSIHHTRLLHGSAPNRSGRARRLLLYGYAAADAWPLSNVPTLEQWDKRMLRGESRRVARCVDLPEILLPNFVGDPGSIYELQRSLVQRAFA